MASLSLQHINKTYPNGFEAVKDFNLEIEDKEFIIFVGPSGCGKSTTLRMIAGLEEITSGTLKIGDRVVNDVEPKDRDIAMVFQNYALYPHMTCLLYTSKENGLLVLRDTGIGIRPEDLPRIFEWGYTGYNGRLDKRSTGVGLALVKQVMEMLGNKMEIRSVLGEGTEVFLDLRRTELEAE